MKRYRIEPPRVRLCDWKAVSLTDADRADARSFADSKDAPDDEREKTYVYLLQSALIDRIANESQVSVPRALVQERTQAMAGELERHLQGQGRTIDEYLETNGTTKEGVLKDFEPAAEHQIRQRAVLVAIAESVGIAATDEDYAEELERLKQRYPVSSEEMIGIFETTGESQRIREDISAFKAAQAVRERLCEAEGIVDPETVEAEQDGEGQEASCD